MLAEAYTKKSARSDKTKSIKENLVENHTDVRFTETCTSAEAENSSLPGGEAVIFKKL